MKCMNRWIYMVIGLVIMLLSGFVYAWSVMAKSISASRLDWSGAQLSLTFTLVMVFFCIGGLVAGFIGKRINTKLYVALSSAMFLAGFLIASFTGDSIVLLYIGFGVLAGFGAGMVYNVVMSTLSAWFPDKQGMISGIMMMGFGISSFIIGKIFAAVTPADGTDTWKMTFRIMGIVIFVVMLICAFVLKRPGEDYQPPAAARNKLRREPATEVGPGKMLKIPAFWFSFLWMILIGSAGMAIISQASGIVSEVAPAISDGNMATIVGLLSLFNGVGRVIFGVVYDKRGFKFTMVTDMCVYIVTVVCILLGMVRGELWLVVIGFIGSGIARGGPTPVSSALISDFFGRKNYSKNFSVVSTNLMVSSFASAISGKLFDVSGSYVQTIYMGLAFLIVGFVMPFVIRRPKASSVKK